MKINSALFDMKQMDDNQKGITGTLQIGCPLFSPRNNEIMSCILLVPEENTAARLAYGPPVPSG